MDSFSVSSWCYNFHQKIGEKEAKWFYPVLHFLNAHIVDKVEFIMNLYLLTSIEAASLGHVHFPL